MAKKSKLLVALMLVLVMVMSAACSDSTEIKKPANVNSDSSVTSGDNTDEKTDGDTVDTGNTVNGAVTIEQTVLFDADGIVVTATGYEEGWMGPEIMVLVENNTDKNVLVTTDSLSVNGYMLPYTSLYADVAAGKKSNESISIMTSELEQSGIETISNLQFFIDISDADNWETLITSDLITLNTSAAGLQQPVDDSGDVLYDSNGVKVVCKGLKQDVIWDGTIVFYMENNSGKSITVSAENVSVNGFMEDAGLWSDLRDGTKIIDGMSLLDLSDLELESIDDVKNIEFNLQIIDSETWDEIVTTDVITLNFE